MEIYYDSLLPGEGKARFCNRTDKTVTLKLSALQTHIAPGTQILVRLNRDGLTGELADRSFTCKPGTWTVGPPVISHEILISCSNYKLIDKGTYVNLACYDQSFCALFPYEHICLSPNPFARQCLKHMQEILSRGRPVRLTVYDRGGAVADRLFLRKVEPAAG